jgi:hypothetical protein
LGADVGVDEAVQRASRADRDGRVRRPSFVRMNPSPVVSDECEFRCGIED